MDAVGSRQQQHWSNPFYLSAHKYLSQISHQKDAKYHCVSRDIKVLNPNVEPSQLVLSGSLGVSVISPSVLLKQHFRVTLPYRMCPAGNTAIQPFERRRLQNENHEPDGPQSYAYCPGFVIEGCTTLFLWCQPFGSSSREGEILQTLLEKPGCRKFSEDWSTRPRAD